MNMLPSTELLGSSKIDIHYQRPHLKEMISISGVQEAQKVLRNHINPKKIDLQEFFWVMLLTHSNRLLGIAETGKGTHNKVLMNTRYIFQTALLSNASSIIIAHNHPSGKLIPSQADIKATQDIKKLCKMMDISLLDHIIITSESYYSFASENKL